MEKNDSAAYQDAVRTLAEVAYHEQVENNDGDRILCGLKEDNLKRDVRNKLLAMAKQEQWEFYSSKRMTYEEKARQVYIQPISDIPDALQTIDPEKARKLSRRREMRVLAVTFTDNITELKGSSEETAASMVEDGYLSEAEAQERLERYPELAKTILEIRQFWDTQVIPYLESNS